VGKPSERIYIIEADPITGEVDRGKVLQTISDFIGTLFAVGGKLQIAADRVAVGEVAVGSSSQLIAETHAIVIRYQSFAPVRDARVAPEPLGDDPEPDELEAELERQAEPVAVELPEPSADEFPDRGDLLTPAQIAELEAAEAGAR
jgi:hypothetical protein